MKSFTCHFINKRKHLFLDYWPEDKLEYVTHELIALGLNFLLECIHLLLLALLLNLVLFSFDRLTILTHLDPRLHLLLALFLKLVVELCSLCELHHTCQVHQPGCVDLSKDCLEQLLGQVAPILYSLGILLCSSARLLQLKVLLYLLGDVAHLLG